MKRVVIVGGGYAGTALARALDPIADVRLVEPRDRFVHNVAAIRALTDPSLLDRMLVPYDRLLSRGRVVQDRAVAVGDESVRLESAGELAADIVVTATGSSYAKPFKPVSTTAAFVEDNRAAHAALRAAKRVVIIGGGPVGVELAGEIVSAFDDKRVTLVSRSTALLPDYSPRLSRSLARQLRRRGVQLSLGRPAETLSEIDYPYPGPVEVGDAPLDADIVFPAIGARPVLPPLAQSPTASSGRLKVDLWLRAAGCRAVFALGDAAETGDPMTTFGVVRQAQWLAKTLRAVVEGQAVEALAPYRPWRAQLMATPLGPEAGATQLPVLGQALVAGPRVTASLKGRDLFIPRCHKALGYPAPPMGAHQGADRLSQGL